jgi:histidinol phosphatase-like PHP family hydrolase
MLKDYSDNEVVNEYTQKLSELRRIFDDIQIDIPVGFEEQIKKDSKIIDDWLSQVKKIQDNITGLRADITQ